MYIHTLDYVHTYTWLCTYIHLIVYMNTLYYVHTYTWLCTYIHWITLYDTLWHIIIQYQIIPAPACLPDGASWTPFLFPFFLFCFSCPFSPFCPSWIFFLSSSPCLFSPFCRPTCRWSSKPEKKNVDLIKSTIVSNRRLLVVYHPSLKKIFLVNFLASRRELSLIIQACVCVNVCVCVCVCVCVHVCVCVCVSIYIYRVQSEMGFNGECGI